MAQRYRLVIPHRGNSPKTSSNNCCALIIGSVRPPQLARPSFIAPANSRTPLAPRLADRAGVRRGLGTALLTFSVATHSFVDLLAIAPIFRRKLHDREVDISIDHQKALVRLFIRDPIARILQGEERLPLRCGDRIIEGAASGQCVSRAGRRIRMASGSARAATVV
jgi:hypothetical protein